MGLWGWIPYPADGSALKDIDNNRDAGIGQAEDADRIKQTAKTLTRENSAEEQEGTDFDGGDGGGVEYFCGEESLLFLK